MLSGSIRIINLLVVAYHHNGVFGYSISSCLLFNSLDLTVDAVKESIGHQTNFLAHIS